MFLDADGATVTEAASDLRHRHPAHC
jgi:hypothetical protein